MNLAGAPLKVTLVAPVRLVPSILTGAPIPPEAGWVSTNGPSPTDKLHAESAVVPDKVRLASWTGAPIGFAPARNEKLPAGGLEKPSKWVFAIGACTLRTETVQCRQSARRRDFENRATSVLPSILPAVDCRPVEVSVGRLDETRIGIVAVLVAGRAESGKDSKRRRSL